MENNSDFSSKFTIWNNPNCSSFFDYSFFSILRADDEKNEMREDMFRQATRFHVEKALKTEYDPMKHWTAAGICFLKAREMTEQRLEDVKNEKKRKNEENETNRRSKRKWLAFNNLINLFNAL